MRKIVLLMFVLVLLGGMNSFAAETTIPQTEGSIAAVNYLNPVVNTTLSKSNVYDINLQSHIFVEVKTSQPDADFIIDGLELNLKNNFYQFELKKGFVKNQESKISIYMEGIEALELDKLLIGEITYVSKSSARTLPFEISNYGSPTNIGETTSFRRYFSSRSSKSYW